MSLNIEDFHENDFGLNLAWFDSANGRDRDLILWQGYCPEGGGECYVRLHPVHFPLLAKELGLLTAQEAAQRVEKMRDRLALLTALVRAHSPSGSPLRIAVDALLAVGPTATGDELPKGGTSCPPAPDAAPARTAYPEDLFSTEGEQTHALNKEQTTHD